VLASAAVSKKPGEITMPHKSAEQLKQKTASLRKKLAEKAASMDSVKIRKAKKKIRRVQRRRRLIDVRAKHVAGKDEGKKAE
jgi:hypothetical protein